MENNIKELDKLMSEIASVTGISQAAILSLDYSVKQQLCVEYELDKSNITEIYNIVQEHLSLYELEKVADVLNVTPNYLKKFPVRIMKELCGIYAMENGEDTLIDSLRNVLREYTDMIRRKHNAGTGK